MARTVQLVLYLFFSPASIGPGLPEFRVFPYENASLEPFETAVAALNPVVAVKVRSAAVHAALAEVYVVFIVLLFPHHSMHASWWRFLVLLNLIPPFGVRSSPHVFKLLPHLYIS